MSQNDGLFIKGFGVALAVLIVSAVLATILWEQEPTVVETGDVVASAVLGPTDMASAGETRSGESVYKSSCKTCHDDAVGGAPKFGDKALWAPRIAKGMDALLKSVTNGLTAMPPRGTCMHCSDEELIGAIKYIVSWSQ